MARRRNVTEGIGGVVLAFGIVFFILVFLLIGALPFEVTPQEQTVLYITSLIMVFSGIALLLKW